MPKKFQNREIAQKTIITAAGRKLRERGFDGVGVDALLREADLTSGAFYSQFKSKDELLLAVIKDGFDKNEKLFEMAVEKGGPRWVSKLLRMYLSPEHRSNVADGCLLPTLSIDAMRSGREARELFGELISQVVEKYAQFSSESGEPLGRERMWAMLAIMTGGVLLARAVENDRTANEILEACRRSAMG
ncbi:MAG: TetR/AcrR family transcriptional regulator [Acidobacteria bacterium]|nr:TetR/AcrR family transcriptional regulator [Acidobacteriota bacterium]MCW5948153.1 TetR/AcrR family transcriptional regulator [Pyrinomonadaceae bacterium]